MGHESNYLDALTWDGSLTREERIARGPFQSGFGIGSQDAAAEAVDRARRDVLVAEVVLNQVKEQAVYALLQERRSIRGIAQLTGIPKSEVGRISRQLHRDGDELESRSFAAAPWASELVCDRVRAAWGHL